MKHSKLTTVLIFFLPSDALMRHLLSAGSKDSVWPFRGIGLVLPSSGKEKKTSHFTCLDVTLCFASWLCAGVIVIKTPDGGTCISLTWWQRCQMICTSGTAVWALWGTRQQSRDTIIVDESSVIDQRCLGLQLISAWRTDVSKRTFPHAQT